MREKSTQQKRFIIVPRFYLHIYDPDRCADENGQEFSDVEAAKWAALAGARELACAELMDGKLKLGHFIEVVDEMGETALKISFGEAAGITD